MSKDIYIDSFGGNIIGALAENTKLLEYSIEKLNKTVTVGSIFKGKVENILPGMQSAFVNIGLTRNGYLSATDMLMDKLELDGKVELSNKLNVYVGQEIMVQAVKEPSGTKGVRLTANISFASRNLVYLPTIDFIGISRKITDEILRDNLTKLITSIKPKEGGFIVRTASQFASKQELKAEAKYLINQYKAILKSYQVAETYSCVYEEGNLAVRMIRDVYTEDIEKFVVSDKDLYDKIFNYSKKTNTTLKNKLVYYNKKTDMFTYYGLDKDIENLTSNTVSLESGAYLVIDKTEALTVIDVNTGKFVGDNNLENTVYQTNLLACSEIARQIRLRNISGIIVIDFIDMVDEDHKHKVLESLTEYTATDRSKCNVIGMTGLGLVEMTRKKKRKESTAMLVKSCPYCHGHGVIFSSDLIVMKIRTQLLGLFANDYNNAIIHLNNDIYEYIIAKHVLKNDIEKIWTNKRIYLVPHKTYHQHFFLVKGDNREVLDLPDKAMLLY